MFPSAVLAPLAELFMILINILRVFGCQKTKLEAGEVGQGCRSLVKAATLLRKANTESLRQQTKGSWRGAGTRSK